MSDSGATAPGLQSFIDKWLAIQPQQRLSLVFVDKVQYPGHIALAALEQELLAAAYGIREPQVAVAKLQWWAEELAAAGASGGRHPLTRVLFDDARAHAISADLWCAPVLAAMAQLEQGTPADFAAQRQLARPLHAALALLETRWWYGASASHERAAELAVINHLLHALLRLERDAERDCLPLPMARLAEFGLNRGQLRSPGAARQRAVQAQLADLLAQGRQALRDPGPLSVFRALESSHGQRVATQAAAGPDSLSDLQQRLPRIGAGSLWQAWRAARAWRRWPA